MSEGKVTFNVVTPARLLAEDTADMVVVPGGDGDFGVLPGHAPLMSTVRPGIVNVYQGEKVVGRYFVAGGFAEVNEQGVSVLAEEAEKVEDIDTQAAKARVEKARAALGAAAAEKAGPEEDALKVAEAYLEAAEAVDGRSPAR
jgi:F-type H+-transporting ATPase subunit epsilon